MPEVTVTLKAGAGFDSPWIVVKGESVSEVGAILAELRAADEETGITPFEGVKIIAQEWQENHVATSAQAMAAVRQSFPNADLVSGTGGNSDASLAAPPHQATPVCTTCGAPTRPKSGTGRNGPYSGFACTADRKHFDFIN